ncbi:MAG: two-component system, OmpR family, alkaline phosphatase synthesis response regulator PhoP [Gemmatimonadaceae bacterium]|jgi:DNA-binding response OmpR family regulator|nr:two-component system, OmpR family, alkaline phosphatase synthesis response regulator PhoP [Gemmatimonadaceae bacterium]
MTETTTRLCHILVADDEPHIGRIIKMKLEQGPFRVSLAYDGQEALDLINGEEPVDLALLDLMMPRLSGLDVLRQIREQERFKTLPCIILTAGGDARHERDALALGATQFLTKPFSPKKLYALVARLTGAPDEAGIITE